MNPQMQAEEDFWNAYEQIGSAGTKSAQSESTDEAMGRHGRGSKILTYKPLAPYLPQWRISA